MILTFRQHIDASSVPLYNLLANGQPHADPVKIVCLSTLNLAKEGEQTVHFFSLDPPALVNHGNVKQLLSRLVLRLNFDRVALGEL